VQFHRKGQRYDWGAVGGSLVTIPEILVGGVLMIGIFLAWERFQTEPLLPLVLFRNRNYSVMVWLGGVNFFAMFGFMLTTTIYLQSVLAFSALQAGLPTVPLTWRCQASPPSPGA
jgi:hypothetical protein